MIPLISSRSKSGSASMSAIIISASHASGGMSTKAAGRGERGMVTPASDANGKSPYSGNGTIPRGTEKPLAAETRSDLGAGLKGNKLRFLCMPAASGNAAAPRESHSQLAVMISSFCGESREASASGPGSNSISLWVGPSICSARRLIDLSRRWAMSLATSSGQPTSPIALEARRHLKSLLTRCGLSASAVHSSSGTNRYTKLAAAMR